MNSSYDGLHISVKKKRSEEASDEVHIQDNKYECFWEVNVQNCLQKILAEEIENWRIYHGLILLRIIKLNIMENQSKRGKERKRQSFIS